MLDAVIIIAFVGSITSLVVSVLTHIKVSKCWGVEIDTYTPPPSATTKLLNNVD